MSSAPAVIPRPTAKPRRPRPPVQRLYSPYRSPSPFIPTRITPGLAETRTRKRPVCTQTDCGSTDIVEDNGSWICNNCGQIVSEGNPFVSDQQWTENAAGASQPQGTYVGEGQSHARTNLTLPGSTRPVGTERSPNDGAKTKQAARAQIQQFGLQFGLIDTILQQAGRIFDLALAGDSFLSGRTLESVSAVCLYIACRRVRNPESRASTLMLIDFAEMTNMNVFTLGSMYTKLLAKLRMGKEWNPNDRVESMPPELLVSRFANELEFGSDTKIIRLDAVNIVKRMSRDWMTTGRRPAGICGAAIILAARMNNYRRTVREVVLVAKITEITINKRLEEFQFTESSTLTVSDFKDNAVRDALRETDPPAYYRAMGQGPEKKRKRKRGRPRKGAETAAELEDEEEESNADADGPSAAKLVRFDTQGFKIPPIPNRTPPIDPRLQPEFSTSAGQSEQGEGQASTHQTTQDENHSESSTATATSFRPRRSGRGRPLGSKAWQPPPPTAGELELERDIEQDVQYVLDHNDAPTDAPRADNTTTNDWSNDRATSWPPIPDPNDVAHNPSAPITAAWQSTPDAVRPAVNTNIGNTGDISLSPTIDPTEFDNDPEVSICLLSQTESSIKERIWVDENAEWLRKDSMKRVKKELKEKERREKGGGDEEQLKGGKTGGRKKKAGKIGDVSYLDRPEGGENQEGDGEEIIGPDGQRRRERNFRDSVERMMAYRAPALSRRINRHVLGALFGEDSGSQEDSGSKSRSGSVVSTARSEVSGNDESEKPKGPNKASIAAKRREAARREARKEEAKKKALEAREDQGDEESEGTASSSPTPPAEGASGRATTTLDSAKRLIPALATRNVPTVVPTGPVPNRRERRQAAGKSPSPAPQAQISPTNAEDDEVLGSVDDSELSSLTSSRNSPLLGVSQHGFGGGDGDDDDDESEGDEDDYVEDDVEAALEGRSARRRLPLDHNYDDQDEDEDVLMGDA